MEEQRPLIKPEDIKIEIIDSNHRVDLFISYEKELVDFLREDALGNQKQRLSVTFLWFYDGNLVSYISLLNDKINLEGNLKEFFQEKGIHYKSLPALKIGRICVDDRFQRRGLGKLMILTTIKIAHEISKTRSGCRFVTLDAKISQNSDRDPLQFYQFMGVQI
ncbi:MAG: GNAT family N-acetyltransferase, partial [Nanoarchaeota archaeon]